jgi:TPR repeat protein
MRLLKAGLVTVLLSLSLAAPVQAGQFDDGSAAYNRGDYATALRLWRPLAEQGNASAQADLGVMYAKGRGVPQDYAAAATWYRKAANQGYAGAETNLGTMYEHGQGVTLDYTEAEKWYRMAADQGDALAKFHLGGMYAYDSGVPHDYVQAYMWLQLAIGGFPAAEAENGARAVKSRDGLAAKMTPSQIEKAQALAAAWRPTTGQ